MAANNIVVVFNDGFSPSQASNCDDSEWTKIDAVLGSRRFLRSSDINSLAMNETSLPSSVGERVLTYSKSCANKCACYAPGSCREKHCEGYRALSDKQGSRSLLTCRVEINEMQINLDNVRNQVSPSCKNFLARSKRRVECYADYEFGQIEGVRVWKITNTAQTVVHSFVAPGGSATICKSLYVNFESLNQPCVASAKLRLKGPNNYLRDHYESVPPFSLFEDTGTILKGAYLKDVGTYELSISPENNTTRKKDFTIIVKNC